MERRALARLAVRVRIVGEARQRGPKHGQDANGQRHRRGALVADHVEHDDQEQDPDRGVGQDRVQRVAEPPPDKQIADGRDGLEEPEQESMDQVPEGLRPDALGIHRAHEQASQHHLTSSRSLRPAHPRWISREVLGLTA
jgi:hypothetical protein